MTDESDSTHQADAADARPASALDAKQDRLKQALRDNLRRRKTQARERRHSASPDAPSPDHDSGAD